MDLQTILEEIGFQPIEAKIYIHLLKNPLSSQQEVSDNLSILRQTVYDIMKKMEIKGFLSSALIGKRKVYSSIDPNMLLNKIKEKEENFLQILPQLKRIRSDEKPDIVSETFLGMQGLKNLFSMTLKSSTEILWISNEKVHAQIFKDYYWENYAKKRIEAKVPLKLLIETKSTKPIWTTDRKEFRIVRNNVLVRDLDSAFAVFEDKVIVYTGEEESLFGVFIRNKALKIMFEKIFMHLWNEGKEV
jgi:sugar-specific transcriptional regulator TrmB